MLPPLATNRPEIRYAWRGAAALVIDTKGSAGRHPLTGFYFRQCRFLKDLRLSIRDREPYMCSICDVDAAHLELTYIHPEIKAGGGGGSGSGGLGEDDGLLYRTLDLRLSFRVQPASLNVVLLITNRWQHDLTLPVTWFLSADYATVDEAQFGIRRQEAGVEASASAHDLTLAYQHPRLPFHTRIRASGASWSYHADRITTELSLPAQCTRELTLVVRAVDLENELTEADETAREDRLRVWLHDVARCHAPGETPIVEITNRSLSDLGSFALLDGAEHEWLVPGAGVPLYQTVWGRDTLTASWQAALFDGAGMLQDVLAMLTRLQGTRIDPARDEQPGRIINQAKSDPLSRIGEGPFDRYYADLASPFMFIIGLGFAYVATGNRDIIERHWPAARAVLDWAREFGDRNGDGYIEYLTMAPNGPTHQGWKDSENAVVDERGEQVSPPIAPCEIQGYYYAALQYMAGLAMVLGEHESAAAWWRVAADLKKQFNRDFWMPDEGFFAFGLNAEGAQIRALTSNAGQCLATGIVSREHVPPLVRRMFQPDLFSGWGIRTLSSRNPAYQPLDYHLGSVWPVENGTIVFGLRRYGFNERALQLTRGLYDLARLWPGGRSPECVGGYGRDELHHPGCYPRANRPQAWNQSVFPLLVQSMLGLLPFAPVKLLMVDPILPSWLPEITVKGLRVGNASVSIRFWREPNGKSRYQIMEKSGRVRVLRQAWLESFPTNVWDRARDLAGSLRGL
ncbi:MAG: MGH1-like glycoside hydrolase domain-containing protein [Gemmatimonadota bacterium]